jgi:hypothetical protein
MAESDPELFHFQSGFLELLKLAKPLVIVPQPLIARETNLCRNHIGLHWSRTL